jgi:hypothetical protein
MERTFLVLAVLREDFSDPGCTWRGFFWPWLYLERTFLVLAVLGEAFSGPDCT